MKKINQPIIIGRVDECEILKNAYENAEAEFVAVFGRRRVGKTYLIRTSLQNQMTFEFTGTKNATMSEQVLSFYNKLCNKDKRLLKKPIPKNWRESFYLLEDYIRGLKSTKRKVIFLDEVPWLATPKSDFLRSLDYFWNSYANWKDNILLIICGSAASWIINKVIRDRGGLHNRVTKRIRLMPFTLSETLLYLQSKGANYTHYHILQLYMVTGGIPHYLNDVDVTLSVTQNINKLCFTKDGILYNEFENLYSSLFRNAEAHIAVIKAMAQKNKGLTRNEIIKTYKGSSGGTLTTILNELIESGFVEIAQPFLNKSKEVVYRLIDEYSVFYLKFIQNNNYKVKDTWLHISNTQSFKSWCGFAFEGICLKHIDNIINALGISGISVAASSFVHKGNEDYKGVQVDLLLERGDGFINLCEIKFCNTAYTITKNYANALRNKESLLRELSKTKKGIFLTLITTYGLTPNKYQFTASYNLDANIFFKT